MAQELSKYSSNIPDYLQNEGKVDRIGNIDSSDMTIPRIKLIHAVSPELVEFEGLAKSGEFWHTIQHKSLGKELIGVPIIARKSQVLWAPRGDDRGILARSRDGKNWDPPEGTFQVQFENNPSTYIWKLAPTVAESGLAEFGSSRPGDKGSPPAATLTYEVLWWFPEHPELGQAIILNSRGALKPSKDLFAAIDTNPREHYYQVYSIKSVVAKNQTNKTYFNYLYTGLGYIDEEDGARSKALFKRYENVVFRASDERDEGGPPSGNGRDSGPVERSSEDKF
jgi:hypothetical protein